MPAFLVFLVFQSPLQQAIGAMLDACDRPAEALAGLDAVSKQVPAPDRPLVDRARSALAHRSCKEILEATARLLGRFGDENASDQIVQHQVIATLASLADRGEKYNVPGRPFLDAATQRARKLAATWPREAENQAHLGAMLGIQSAASLEALEAFGRCLELDPRHALCRKSFAEIAEYYQAPRCERDGLRAVALVANRKTIIDRKSGLQGGVVLAARDGKPAVHLYLDDVARSRLVAQSKAPPGALVLEVEGKNLTQLDLGAALGKELVEVPGLKIEDVCRKVTRKALPPALGKYRSP